MTILTRWLLPAALICGATATVRSAPRQSTPGTPVVRVTIDKVSLADVAQDHLQLSFSLTLLADRDVAVRQIAFDNVRLNDVPLYVAPVEQRLSLKANEAQQIGAPLRLSLYFRDLDTVRPLQTLLLDKRVSADGTVYLDAELSPLVKLLLLGRRVRVPVTVHQEVQLNVPDNTLLQSIMPRALGAAELAVSALSSLKEGVLRRTSGWRDELWRDFAPSLLLTYVRFTVRTKSGERIPFEFTGTGYRISPNQFVVCKSLVEPWKFDPDVASALKFGGLSLDRSGYEMSVWPINARLRDDSNQLMNSTGFRLGQGDFRRIYQPSDANASFYALQPAGRPKKIALHKRDSTGNLVLFEFRNSPPFSGPIKKSSEDSKSWDRVAIFRFPGGINERQARADLVFVPASSSGAKITLGTPLDTSAIGSPVITQDGIIGLLQDHAAAVPLDEVFKTLKLK